MAEARIEDGRLRLGARLAVSFHRTLRVPDDGNTYPLPAGIGLFPIFTVILGETTLFAVPMYQREALWIGFSGAPWKPNTVKVIVGGINAVSGKPDDGTRLNQPQDYLVCPQQPWIDGFNAGDGVIRQFVAMPLGAGYGIEAGHGLPEMGGIEMTAFEPRPGLFPDGPPPRAPGRQVLLRQGCPESEQMVLGAGGRIRQKLYADTWGVDAWSAADRSSNRIVLLDSHSFASLTGRPAPPSPIDAEAYRAAGIPWFDLYDEACDTVVPVGGRPPRTIADVDEALGIAPSDSSIGVSRDQVRVLRYPPARREPNGAERSDG